MPAREPSQSDVQMQSLPRLIGAVFIGLLLSMSGYPVLCQDEIPSLIQLLENTRFQDGARGWSLRNAVALDEIGYGESLTVRLDPVSGADGASSHVGISIGLPPANRELVFAVWLRTEAMGHPVRLDGFAYGDAGLLYGKWNEQRFLQTTDWEEHAVRIVCPPGTKSLAIRVDSQSDQALLVSAPSLMALGAAEAEILYLVGAGIVEAKAGTIIAANTNWRRPRGTVTFPIPIETAYQVPLCFEVMVDPPENFRKFRWIKRPDGHNWLVEITVCPFHEPTDVSWRALVLVDDKPRGPLPRVSEPEVPEAAARWLRGTACVQSDDPDITTKAGELAEPQDDIESYVRAVIDFVRSNRGKPGVNFSTLDARKALDAGGSSTGKANLAAALLRARGLPARTVAQVATWSGPLYEHWLVEYWHPGAGWIWAESTLGRMQPGTNSVVVLNIANPEDEDRAFDEALGHSGVALGVPYLAVHLISDELDRGIKGTTENYAKVVWALGEESEELRRLMSLARTAFAEQAAECLEGILNEHHLLAVKSAVDTKDYGKLVSALEHGDVKDALREDLHDN